MSFSGGRILTPAWPSFYFFLPVFKLIQNIILSLGMLNKMIHHFLQFFILPPEEQDYSEYEEALLYLSTLFVAFLWYLYG